MNYVDACLHEIKTELTHVSHAAGFIIDDIQCL